MKAPGTRYTDEELQFIREHIHNMSNKEIASHLGRTVGSVKSAMTNYSIRKGRKLWTEKEDRILRNHYPDTEMDELFELLPGRTKQSIYGRAGKLGINRSDVFMRKQLQELSEKLQEKGKRHRFRKGHEPVNKGLKQSEYMSSEAIERTKKTRFKKGHKPNNTKWDGAISIRHGHKKRGQSPCMWIRLENAKWQQYQRYLWEKVHGPIPKDRILVCRNGDTLNPVPSNWELITRAEHARRNRNHEKMIETMRLIRQGKKKPKKITPYQAAKKLSGGDPELRDYLLEHREDLVRIALLNWKLKRSIKYPHNDN